MMSLIENIPGATPIDDLSDLIPTHITIRAELNEWEAANILKAAQKYLSIKKQWRVDTPWFKKVHADMFDETWKWAGKFRQSNYNLGLDWQTIPDQTKLLEDDIKFWEQSNQLNVFKQSVRLHHRLVKIHPFVNGNGRHARLVADVFLFNHNHTLPQWPDRHFTEGSRARETYIAALRAADKGDYSGLEDFTAGLIR